MQFPTLKDEKCALEFQIYKILIFHPNDNSLVCRNSPPPSLKITYIKGHFLVGKHFFNKPCVVLCVVNLVVFCLCFSPTKLDFMKGKRGKFQVIPRVGNQLFSIIFEYLMC